MKSLSRALLLVPVVAALALSGCAKKSDAKPTGDKPAAESGAGNATDRGDNAPETDATAAADTSKATDPAAGAKPAEAHKSDEGTKPADDSSSKTENQTDVAVTTPAPVVAPAPAPAIAPAPAPAIATTTDASTSSADIEMMSFKESASPHLVARVLKATDVVGVNSDSGTYINGGRVCSATDFKAEIQKGEPICLFVIAENLTPTDGMVLNLSHIEEGIDDNGARSTAIEFAGADPSKRIVLICMKTKSEIAFTLKEIQKAVSGILDLSIAK